MHKCLLFHEVPEGTHYKKGSYSYVSTDEAKKYLEKGIAELYSPEKKEVIKDTVIDTDLPEDFPGRESLLKANLSYIKDLEVLEDFLWVPGIGKATNEKIKECLETL